jgi:hypothetical protein
MFLIVSASDHKVVDLTAFDMAVVAVVHLIKEQ